MIVITSISVAASCFILFMSYGHYTARNPNKQGEVVEDIAQSRSPSLEFNETNEYYNQQFENQIANIKQKLAYSTPENRAQLDRDLNEMKANNIQLVKEIACNEDQALAIFYLVKHYETKIQTLEYIDNQLENHIITQKA